MAATLFETMHDLSPTGVRYFQEVVRRGSIRSAAEGLFVAPSAISRQIALLEESIGAELLERRQGRGGLKLTSAGESLMRYARTLHNEKQRLTAEIESMKGLRKGAVSFGMPESLVREFMPRFITNFSRLAGVNYLGRPTTTILAGGRREF